MNTYEAIDAEAKRRGWQRWEVIADRIDLEFRIETQLSCGCPEVYRVPYRDLAAAGSMEAALRIEPHVCRSESAVAKILRALEQDREAALRRQSAAAPPYAVGESIEWRLSEHNAWIAAKVTEVVLNSDRHYGWIVGTDAGHRFTGPALTTMLRKASHDPLDVEYDGLTLRYLLLCDRLNRQEGETSTFTSAQRAAISAHWSAELRARIANAPKPGPQVVLDCAEEL